MHKNQKKVDKYFKEAKARVRESQLSKNPVKADLERKMFDIADKLGKIKD